MDKITKVKIIFYAVEKTLNIPKRVIRGKTRIRNVADARAIIAVLFLKYVTEDKLIIANLIRKDRTAIYHYLKIVKNTKEIKNKFNLTDAFIKTIIKKTHVMFTNINLTQL